MAMLSMRLTTKIQLILLGISLVFLFLFGYVALSGMEGLGEFVLESNISLKETVVADSKENVKSQTEGYLVRIAEDQAAFCNAQLETIAGSVNMMAMFASKLRTGTREPSMVHVYSQKEKPDDIYEGLAYSLAPGVSRDEVLIELHALSQINKIFVPIFSQEPYINLFRVGTESGLSLLYPWRAASDSRTDLRRYPWYTKALTYKEIVWGDPYIDAESKQLSVTCARQFYIAHDAIKGVVSADIMLVMLQEKITGTQIGKCGYAFMADSNGTILIRPDVSSADSRWDGMFETKNLMQASNKNIVKLATDMRAGKTGIKAYSLNGSLKYVAYAPIATTRWMLGIVIPVSEVLETVQNTENKIVSETEQTSVSIKKQIENVKNILLSAFIIFVFIIFAVALRLANKITRPILILHEGIKRIGGGDLNHRLDIRTGDEIEDLAGAVNKMTEALNSHIEHVRDAAAAREKIQSRLESAEAVQESMRQVISEVLDGSKTDYSFEWLLPFMSMEKYGKGEVLFTKGDRINKLFYIKSGAIRLLEIDKVVGEGAIIGETGMLSPQQVRTMSAVCEDDLEILSLTDGKAKELFYQKPSFIFELIQLSIKRFMENLRETTAAKERIESDLKIASEIQTSMLPRVFPPFPDRKEFDIFASMKPAREVGGDFYDYFFINENKLCFLIGDVSGKGVPAALFMVVIKTLLKHEALSGFSSPADILASVNSAIYPDNDTCMFATVFCSTLDVQTGELCFANAGHNPPVVCRAGNEADFITIKPGFLMGPMEEAVFESDTLQLKPGDTFLIYTDGVTEAMNETSQLFSDNRLKQALSAMKDREVTDIVQGIHDEILTFAGKAPQSDDITMVALRFFGPRQAKQQTS